MEPYENIALVTRYIQSVLPEASTFTVERAAEGGSTIVYRIQLPATIYYLRIWPERGAGFGPERNVHDQLYMAGLHVPQVIACEYENALLQRSVMLTTTIAGRAIGYGEQPTNVASIVRQAGYELAQIHTLPVHGYGWIQRQALDTKRLRAEYATLPAWLEQHFAAQIDALGRHPAFTAHDVQRVRVSLDEAAQRFEHEPATVAHGDFDVTHIFYEHERYTGIIDFGELRGTHPIYDLGHFAIENSALLPFLLEGYRQSTALTGDVMSRIQLTGTLIAARRVGQRLLQGRPPHQPDVAFVTRALAQQ